MSITDFIQQKENTTVLVAGEILFDVFPEYRRIGGAPFNFAFHLKKLGFPVRFVSRVGADDRGKEILDFLDVHDFLLEDIQVDPDRETGSVQVHTDSNGDHAFEIQKDAAYDFIEFTDEVKHLVSEDVRLIYFGTLIQRTDHGFHTMQRILRNRTKAAEAFLDINLRPECYTPATIEASLRAADILKLNLDELVHIAGPAESESDVQRAVDRLREEYAVKKLILTKAEAGSELFSDNGRFTDGPKTGIHVADTVGAGDAYAAMAAAGHLIGLPEKQTICLAGSFADRICGIKGALPDTGEFYGQFIKETGGWVTMPQNGLYIQMFSIHGLVRAENMELGYDSDTGGQVKYVIELGKALAENENIRRVDLFTRLISDKSFSDDYGRPVEEITDKFRIVRIQCGGRKYMRKELLWPYLDEYVDKTIKFTKRENSVPDLVHGHYPDAGYVAMELARIFGIPFVYTGHSLGRSKKARLLNEGFEPAELNKQIKLDHRIEMEERILKYADMVVTSTRQEKEEQYGQYHNGRLPQFRVIPPGIDIEKFQPFYYDRLEDEQPTEEAMFAKASVIKELKRFFQNPDKPVVLALCRPDKRKNIEGLVQAYGEDYELQAIANLAVFAGIRKDIALKEETARDVLTRMLLLMDKYDLYGKMAVPKTHDFENEVPELYKVAAERGGVFVNPALTEPFGITLLEAAATGLPIVATNDGGPMDIIENCRNGYIVDPLDTKAISEAVRDIIVHEDKWAEFSKNGVINTRKYYTWESHAETYIEEMKTLHSRYERSEIAVKEPENSIGKRLAGLNHMIITDIDNTLLGGGKKDLEELMALLKENSTGVGFGVATGRVLESAVKVLRDNNVIMPDVIISSVGSEISYGQSHHRDKGWESHISKNWNRDRIISLLDGVDYLEIQEEEVQRRCKISYNMSPGKDRLAGIHNILTRNRCHYTLIYSHEAYLDILPYRASKGKAIRYLSYKWEIPLRNFLVCGDSGNDEEMLKGEPAAVVVGNYSSELEKMKSAKNVYFAERGFAGGMIEGMRHYRFFEKAKGKGDDDN